jgi:hypothetical protein
MSDHPDDVAVQVIRRRAERCESMAALLTEKGTGGHPDQYNPDPIFLDAAGGFILAAWDLCRAADAIESLLKQVNPPSHIQAYEIDKN